MLTQWKERLSDLLAAPDEVPAPLSVPDKWIGHSVMHKAIRRGNVALACAAGTAMLTIDRSGLWKRLMTIACEDVGIGDEEVLIACAAAADDGPWRTRMGEARVVTTLCRLLAEAEKDRSADNMICAARTHPGLEHFREMAGSRPVAERLELVEDKALPLPARAVAAWYASGVEWWPERRVGPGDLDGLLDACQGLGASADLVAATRIAVRKVHEPIVLMPALLSSAARGSVCETIPWEPPPAEPINGLPPCVFDRFTRTGKQAIARFARENEPVRTLLETLAPDRRWSAVMAYGVFHAEGGRLGKRLVWRDAPMLERLGLEADFLPEGIGPDDFTRLIATVESQLDHLNAIRARIVADTFPPAQGQLL